MILAWLRREVPSPLALMRFDEAMRELDHLVVDLRRMARHPARSVVSDIIQNRDNVPYLTTLFEANAEMKSAADQRRDS